MRLVHGRRVPGRGPEPRSILHGSISVQRSWLRHCVYTTLWRRAMSSDLDFGRHQARHPSPPVIALVLVGPAVWGMGVSSTKQCRSKHDASRHLVADTVFLDLRAANS